MGRCGAAREPCPPLSLPCGAACCASPGTRHASLLPRLGLPQLGRPGPLACSWNDLKATSVMRKAGACTASLSARLCRYLGAMSSAGVGQGRGQGGSHRRLWTVRNNVRGLQPPGAKDNAGRCRATKCGSAAGSPCPALVKQDVCAEACTSHVRRCRPPRVAHIPPPQSCAAPPPAGCPAWQTAGPASGAPFLQGRHGRAA